MCRYKLFSIQTRQSLETFFSQNPYPDKFLKEKICAELNLTKQQLKNWLEHKRYTLVKTSSFKTLKHGRRVVLEHYLKQCNFEPDEFLQQTLCNQLNLTRVQLKNWLYYYKRVKLQKATMLPEQRILAATNISDVGAPNKLIFIIQRKFKLLFPSTNVALHLIHFKTDLSILTADVGVFPMFRNTQNGPYLYRSEFLKRKNQQKNENFGKLEEFPTIILKIKHEETNSFCQELNDWVSNETTVNIAIGVTLNPFNLMVKFRDAAQINVYPLNKNLRLPVSLVFDDKTLNQFRTLVLKDLGKKFSFIGGF